MPFIEYQTPEVLVHINTCTDPIIFHYRVYQQQGRHIVLTQQGNFFVYHDTSIWGQNSDATLVIDNRPVIQVTLPFPGLPEKDPHALAAMAEKIIRHANSRA